MDNALGNQISKRRKAAAIVQLMVEGGNVPALSQLPESLQFELTDELGGLRSISRDLLHQIVAEFMQEVDSIGLTASGTRDGAIEVLADHLSPPLAGQLRKQLAAFRNGDHWPTIAALPDERLVDLLGTESIEVGAVALSKMPISKAAQALTRLPGERARKITYAMQKTADIGPDAVRRIGAALAQEYGHPAPRAFEKAPVQRLGAILNATQTETREDVLEGLDATDQPFASDVRKAIFTFKDIAPRVKETDIPSCIRAVDGTVLVTALAAALKGDAPLVATAEFILGSLSQRMATQLREDVSDRGYVKRDEGEAAMAEVTKAIRELVEQDMIKLKDPDEETEEGSDS